MSPAARVPGDIMVLQVDRGYGFIRCATVPSLVFFHCRAVVGQPFTALKFGQRVEVELDSEPGPKGPRAAVVFVNSEGGDVHGDT